MSIVLITDVFGVTPALLKLKDKLGANTIVDPYKGQCMGFINEADAYTCFVNTVGLDSYVSIVLKALKSLNCESTVIGFSVGASAIWKLSQRNENNLIKQAFCFYSSQIRNYTKITPCFLINLVFPENESHFDVVEIINILKVKPNVQITQVEYLHGFMNEYSTNFNNVGYQKYIALMRETISEKFIHSSA